MVYESPHKRQCDKALILRKIIIKSLGLIQTEQIDSKTNFLYSSIAEFRPNH
ncbi:hypothetical protein M6B38_109600 [Iris pallida]|uniref:Reverse transcriptase Ty1/copia-type domain-containing protein n=1 Tax=Iris pallida TaxID=29817 RepID=A0AAX6E8Q0_IRIPA|nr:hypothetical protein M6B38_109600 [Iris pallida]